MHNYFLIVSKYGGAREGLGDLVTCMTSSRQRVSEQNNSGFGLICPWYPEQQVALMQPYKCSSHQPWMDYEILCLAQPPVCLSSVYFRVVLLALESALIIGC